MKRESVSSRFNYGNLFEDWELRVARRVIKEFCGDGRAFQKSDFETLLRDALTTWYFERKGYNPTRKASRKTYMRKVLKHDLLDRVKERKSGKRTILWEAGPLHAPVGDEDDSPTLQEILPGPDPLSSGAVDLELDLAKILGELSAQQQRILGLLKEGSPVTRIAEALDIPRTTIHDEITRIRKLFESKGLHDYLK